MRRVLPDVATSNPGRGTAKPLQLRIFRESRVIEDLTFREVPVLPKNACSRLSKVPPCLRRSGFAQAGARLWENSRRIVRRLPGEATHSTPARFRYCFFCNWRFLFHLCLPLLLLFPGCGLWEGGLPEHIIARINREEVTVDEFNREFKELVNDQNREGSRSELREVKEAYLNQMIERKILAQEARRLGIRVSAEELSQAILEIKRDYPGEGFGEKLGLTGISLEEWKVRLEEKLLAEKMVRGGHPYKGKIEEKSAREFYETHRSLFQLPQRMRVRQIVVTDGNEAIQIQKRLKKGESFEKLAKEKSLGPEKVQGGDLGYFSEGERPAEFDHVFSMEVGAISEVIKSPYGYHLFKLEEKSEPRELSFEEAKKSVLQRLEREKGEEEYQRWFKGLREKAKVKVNKKWLRS